MLIGRCVICRRILEPYNPNNPHSRRPSKWACRYCNKVMNHGKIYGMGKEKLKTVLDSGHSRPDVSRKAAKGANA